MSSRLRMLVDDVVDRNGVDDSPRHHDILAAEIEQADAVPRGDIEGAVFVQIAPGIRSQRSRKTALYAVLGSVDVRIVR